MQIKEEAATRYWRKFHVGCCIIYGLPPVPSQLFRHSDMQWQVCSKQERITEETRYVGRETSKRNQLVHIVLVVKIILKEILWEYSVKFWTSFNWLGGRHQKRSFIFFLKKVINHILQQQEVSDCRILVYTSSLKWILSLVVL